MTQFDPRSQFAAFYDNLAIRSLSAARRWTISGRLGGPDDEDERKAPIDIRHLLEGCSSACRHEGPLRGAWALDERCLIDLDGLVRAVPTASNHAFHVQAQTDGLLVIDIEKTCPPEIAHDLLRLPSVLYSEVSMSGRGYHLLVPLPENFFDFEIAASKRVLREEHGWYELLLDHWVTFTRVPVPEDVEHAALAADPVTEPAHASVEALYAQLAELTRAGTGSTGADVGTAEEMPLIPYSQDIIRESLQCAEGRLKTPGDFDDDLSRYEFSVLASLFGWIRTAVSDRMLYDVEYSESDLAWLLYSAAVKVIPHRPKHDQRRNGRPFLLDRAASLIAARRAAAQDA